MRSKTKYCFSKKEGIKNGAMPRLNNNIRTLTMHKGVRGMRS